MPSNSSRKSLVHEHCFPCCTAVRSLPKTFFCGSEPCASNFILFSFLHKLPGHLESFFSLRAGDYCLAIISRRWPLRPLSGNIGSSSAAQLHPQDPSIPALVFSLESKLRFPHKPSSAALGRVSVECVCSRGSLVVAATSSRSKCGTNRDQILSVLRCLTC